MATTARLESATGTESLSIKSTRTRGRLIALFRYSKSPRRVSDGEAGEYSIGYCRDAERVREKGSGIRLLLVCQSYSTHTHTQTHMLDTKAFGLAFRRGPLGLASGVCWLVKTMPVMKSSHT